MATPALRRRHGETSVSEELFSLVSYYSPFHFDPFYLLTLHLFNLSLFNQCSPHAKRDALRQSHNYRREAIIFRLHITHDLPDRWPVIWFDAAAQGKRKQLPGQRADKDIRPIKQTFFKTGHARELAPVGQTARSIHRFAFFHHSPPANRIKIFQ